MRIAIIAGLALSLAACGAPVTAPPTGNATGPVIAPTAAPTVAVTADAITADAMFAVETLYNVPAQAYVAANATGKLTPAMKAQIKPYLTEAYSGVKKARGLYASYQAMGKVTDALAFWETKKSVEVNANAANAAIPN